jgi:putative oxidoreductase
MFWDDFRKKYTDVGILLMRVVFGYLFILHGLGKFGLFGDKVFADLPLMIQAAGVIEFVAGVLLVIGLFSNWAAFISSGTMAVAYWSAHAGWNPIASGGQAAAIFAFGFLLLWFIGPGKYSIDAKMAKK